MDLWFSAVAELQWIPVLRIRRRARSRKKHGRGDGRHGENGETIACWNRLGMDRSILRRTLVRVAGSDAVFPFPARRVSLSFRAVGKLVDSAVGDSRGAARCSR